MYKVTNLLGESVAIHQDIKSLKSVGIHWATFKLTYEHYLEPKSQTLDELRSKGLNPAEFEVINIGETVEGA